MNNFYKENKGYKELVEKLNKINLLLGHELIEVVGDAIQYGIAAMDKDRMKK